MSSFIDFLTTKEIIIVYIISGLAFFMCLIIYIAEKNSDRLRRKHNTRELNKLVKQIKERVPDVDVKEPIQDTPIITSYTVDNKSQSVDEMLENTGKINKLDTVSHEPYIIKAKEEQPSIIEVEENVNNENKLEYTSIEPDQNTAKIELTKLEEQLIKEEEQNISMTDYEEEQEATAIISLDELIKKGKELYNSNEYTQYKDEGNEPISLQDLEKKVNKKASSYNQPFIIENIVPEEDINKEINSINELIDNSNNLDSKKNHKKFQNSPIISPIYGIEKINNIEKNDLELENTANYEKLDQEIKKTNEFLMTLKDLQEKLD